MVPEYIKKNYFEILLCTGITIGGLFRLMFPDLRKQEMNDTSFENIHEYLLILFELLAVYFIFFTNTHIKNLYLSIFMIVCIFIALYYLSKKSISTILSEVKKLCIFSNDIKSIWFHLIYIYILIYIIYIKN
jgi:hypothetical protein